MSVFSYSNSVYTELEYENTDMNDTGGKNDYQ